MFQKYKPVPQCIENHEAHKACISKSCQNPSLICTKKGCKSQQYHTKCSSIIDIDPLMRKLLQIGVKKQQSYRSLKDLYEHMIKKIKMQIDQLMLLIDDMPICFNAKQKEIYKLLKQGPSKSVTPAKVKQLCEQMDQQALTYFQIQGIKRSADTYVRYKQMKQLNTLLKNIRQIWPQKQYQLEQINSKSIINMTLIDARDRVVFKKKVNLLDNISDFLKQIQSEIYSQRIASFRICGQDLYFQNYQKDSSIQYFFQNLIYSNMHDYNKPIQDLLQQQQITVTTYFATN